jgi:hypothetical protein
MQQYNFTTTAVDPSIATTSFINAMRAGQDTRANQQTYDVNTQNQEIAKRNYDYQLGVRDRLAQLQPEIGTNANARLEYFSLLEPEKAKIISAEINKQQQDQRDGGATIALQAVTAIKSGNIPAAQKLLTDRATGYEAAGNTDAATRLRAQAANLQDPAVVSMLETGALFSSPEIFQNYLKQNSQPSENKLREGQATEAAAKATESPSNIAKNQAQADEAKSNTRLKDIEALYKGTGTLTPIERAGAEQALRDELLQNPQYKSFQIAKVAVDSMKVASANGAGDLNLIYNLNKILDPNSVVRESEFANAASTGGLPANIMSYVSKLSGNGMLPDNVRKQLINEAERMLIEKENQIAGVKNGITGIAKRRGLATENIFYDDANNGKTTETKQSSQKGYFDANKMTITGPDGTIYKYSDVTKFMNALQQGQNAGVF